MSGDFEVLKLVTKIFLTIEKTIKTYVKINLFRKDGLSLRTFHKNDSSEKNFTGPKRQHFVLCFVKASARKIT